VRPAAPRATIGAAGSQARHPDRSLVGGRAHSASKCRRDRLKHTSNARSNATTCKAAGDAGDDALVFERDGEPIDLYAAFRAVRSAGKKAGVPWVGLHTLRHSCASVLFRRGFNAKQVQACSATMRRRSLSTRTVHLLNDDLPEPTFFDALLGEDRVSHESEKAQSEAAGR
jgi:integrase